jgi:transcriptional regulator with XRE-family HTH domain
MRTFWPYPDPNPMPAPSDPTMRKALGARIKELRKHASSTQKELAKAVSVTPQQLNKYESGLSLPPADMLRRLARALDVTIDYLVTGERDDDQPLTNTRLLNRFRAMDGMNADDLETILRVIEAMIVQHRATSAIAPVDRKTG